MTDSDYLTTELEDLVSYPREDLHIELKQQIELEDEVAKAKLARHLAAICNHGGGYILFGFQDDGVSTELDAEAVANISRDSISSIVSKYLEPSFQCDVLPVVSAETGYTHPVVRIPPHGSIPTISKKNGPHDNSERPQGIRKGLCYIRVPGPKSVAIESPDQWHRLIRRCVLAERDVLRSEISAILGSSDVNQREPRTVTATTNSEIERWHTDSRVQYLEFLGQCDQEWPVDISENYYQFSYIIHETGGLSLHNLEGFREALRTANEAVKDVVWTGWSMFHQFTRPEIAPYVNVYKTDTKEIELYETNHLGKLQFDTTVPDFWRVGLDGRATIVRPYREDRNEIAALAERHQLPGNWLSPFTLIREVYEVVLHAHELSKYFGNSSHIQILCSWVGLEGRKLAEFDPGVDFHDRVSHVNSRTTSAFVRDEELPSNLPTVVSALADPIMRVFAGWSANPEWIEGKVPKFRML